MRGLKRTCAWRSYELRAGDVHLVDEVLRLAGAPVAAGIAATKPADEPLKLSGPEDAVIPVLTCHGPTSVPERADTVLVVRGDVVTDALLATSVNSDDGTSVKLSHNATPFRKRPLGRRIQYLASPE